MVNPRRRVALEQPAGHRCGVSGYSGPVGRTKVLFEPVQLYKGAVTVPSRLTNSTYWPIGLPYEDVYSALEPTLRSAEITRLGGREPSLLAALEIDARLVIVEKCALATCR